MRTCATLIALCICAWAPMPVLATTADSVFLNGEIYTASATQPWIEAVAIKDGRFAFVGKNAEAEKYIGPETLVYDLEGKMVMPGIHDAHTHMLWAGTSAVFGCRLSRHVPLEKVISELQNCAEKQQAQDWLVADSVWSDLFPNGRFHRRYLDAAFPDKSVMLVDGSYHHAFLNSKALSVAGINANTSSPTGGEVVIGDDQEPTGELVETATLLVADYLPRATDEQNAEAIRWSSQHLSKFGITSVQEASANAPVLKALQTADRDTGLQQRVAAHLIWGSRKFSGNSAEADERLIDERNRYAGGHVEVDFVKVYVDGSPTPPFFTEVTINPLTEGIALENLLIPRTVLSRLVTRLDRMGIKVKMHVAGPGSAHLALDAIAAARMTQPLSKIRHELAHSAAFIPSDIERMGSLNAVAEMSPTLWHFLPKMTGLPPLPAWPFRALQQQGVMMTVGSDWSVTDEPNVFPALQGIVEHGNQSLGLEEALQLLTLNGAISVGWEQDQGSIEPGKIANLIVLDRNLFKVPTAEIGGTRVLRTVFEGKVVHDEITH